VSCLVLVAAAGAALSSVLVSLYAPAWVWFELVICCSLSCACPFARWSLFVGFPSLIHSLSSTWFELPGLDPSQLKDKVETRTVGVQVNTGNATTRSSVVVRPALLLNIAFAHICSQPFRGRVC
jgi:hypothetical protein